MSLRHENQLHCRHCQSLSRRPGPLPAHSVPWAKSQYRRNRPVKPLHQLLDVTLNFSAKSLTGSTTIEFEVLHQDVDAFDVEAVDLTIEKVLFKDKPIRFRVEEGHLVLLLPERMPQGARGQVQIFFTTQEPRAGLYFVGPNADYPNKPQQVFTQGQDDDSRYWIPCFDEPGIKFTFEMKVKAPANFICTSNGRLLEEKRSGEQWYFHWKMDQPIPAYLVTLTAGQFAEIKDSWKDKPIHYLAEKGKEDELKLACQKTPDMMEHFSKLLGVDYPYDKYHQIVVSEFPFGGMENTTATTLTDLTLHPQEIEENYSSVDLVAHELAHQWFGDLVTCKTWSHGWLNESWATFMEYVYKARDKGAIETQYYRYEDFKAYQEEDSSYYRRPIVTNRYSDPAEIWDRHLYQKGGLILNMLMAEIGEEAFWRGTQIYLKRHAGGVVETIDFQRALEESCQRPLDWYFDQWIFHAGHPELKVSFEWDEKEKIGQIKVEQTQKADFVTPIHTFNSFFEVHHANGKIERLALHMNSTQKNLLFKADEKPQAIRFDTSNDLLKTLSWELPEEMIFAQLKLEGDPVGKVWAMKSLGKKPSRRAESALIERLTSDSFWGVRAEASEVLAKVKTDRARDALLSALTREKDAKVRAMLAKALGAWKEEIVFQTLKSSAASDPNTFVRAYSISSMGKTKSPKAMDEILRYRNSTSWADLVLKHVWMGLRNLEDEKVVPHIVEGTKWGQPYWSRPVAVQQLGEVAPDRRDIDNLLLDLLKDRQFSVPRAAVLALESRGHADYASRLDEVGFSVVDGHLKFMAHAAAQRLREGTGQNEQVRNLKTDLEKLIDENQKLKQRLELLEDKFDLERQSQNKN